MESNVVTAAVAAGVDPLGRPVGRPSGRADAPPAPEQAPRAQSDAQFLAHAAATETPGTPRSTFARFIVDQKTHEVSVQILDAQSQEVIRTIPSEDLRQLAHRYRASNGFVLDSAV